MGLVGLNREPRQTDPMARDLRWRERREAWRVAEVAKQSLQTGAEKAGELADAAQEETVRLVLLLARATGFWSVWMTVFADDNTFRAVLTDAFPGTRATE